jgi:NADPH:quinone reductase-like Zn-dependent oxidoreductase
MKAIFYTEYGTPDVLHLKELEKPVPGDNELLIKVHAASVNSWDWDLLRGKPFVIRLWGLFKPKYNIPGADIAGQVEAVGKNVKRFRAGDEVFGDLSACGWGGFAEYVCVPENALALKPAALTFEQAAALPQAGVMALQSVRDKGKVKPGQKVLIIGAGGGVGTFALQIAKSLGAEVSAVDIGAKLEMLRALGAATVIDYTQEDFSKNGQCHDLIIDVVAHRSIFDYKRVLNPGGIFVMVGGTTSALLQAAFLGLLISMSTSRKMGILAHQPNKDLAYLAQLVEDGTLLPVIDKRYPLSAAAEAMRYFGSGQVKGKVIITM